MKTESIATALYAAFVLLGGMIGYFTQHSLPSLIMGTGSALLMFLFAWGIFKNCVYSKYGALILSGLLLAFFAYRFLLSYKFFPGGIMVLLSLGLVILLARGLKTGNVETKGA